MKNITNAILSRAIDGLTYSEASNATGVCRSNLAKYKHSVNPSAETWLKSLVRLGHVKVKEGQLIIKSDVITKEYFKDA